MNKKIGIITLPLHRNVGGILQNYALQTVLKRMGYECETIEPTNKGMDLPFTSKYIKKRKISSPQEIKENDYSYILIGSDQVWRKRWTSTDLAFGVFANNWKNNKIFVYGASLGTSFFEYSENEIKTIIEPQLKQIQNISVREPCVKGLIDKICGEKRTEIVCDPTMLLTQDDYTSLCDYPSLDKCCVGEYFLDNHDIYNFYNTLADNTQIEWIYKIQQDPLDFIRAFRDCKLIVTDSFHGCIFSLIFNKPFICIKNNKRGGARFDLIGKTYGFDNRIVDNINNLSLDQIKNLLAQPNFDLDKERQKGYQYLNKCLNLQ